MSLLRSAATKIESIVRDKNRSFLIAVVLAFPLFTLYVLDAASHVGSVLFHHPTRSYSRFHDVHPEKAHYDASFSEHARWKKKVRTSAVGSVAALVVAVVISAGSTLLVGSLPTHAAAKGVTCSGDSSTPTAVDGTLFGSTDDVTFSGIGWCEVTGAMSVTSVTVGVDVTLTHPNEDTTGLDITTSGDFTLLGSINASEKGCGGGASSYNHGEGPDVGNSNICTASTAGYGRGADGPGGAGHGNAGGRGWHAGSAGYGIEYGTADGPTLLGSGGGGGASAAGGAGGGLVVLNVGGTATITSGSILANGANGGVSFNSSGGAAGSGGSVSVTANVLDGSGTVSAFGGDGGGPTNASSGAGGGGGGGIVYVARNSGTYNVDTVTAAGGAKGTQNGGTNSSEAGEAGSTFLLDSSDDSVHVTEGLLFSDGSDFARGSFIIDSGTNLHCLPQTTLTISTTGDYTDNGSTWTCDEAVTNVDLMVTGTLTTDDITWAHTAVSDFDLSAATWNVGGTTNVWDFTTVGALMDWDVTNDLTLNNVTYTANTPGTSSALGGTITFDNTTTNVSLVNTDIISSAVWTIGSLAVDSNSSIVSDGLGCLASPHYGSGHGQGPDVVTGICAIGASGWGDSQNIGAGGAGHGGKGGRGAHNSSTDGGRLYDDATNPVLFGSGGGGDYFPGGNGGGKVIINLSNGTNVLSLDGLISANGIAASSGAQSRGGGGSGGSVNIVASSLTCTDVAENAGAGNGSCDFTPTITANGGAGGTTSTSNGAGGGGGAGIVFVNYNTSAIDVSNFVATSALAGTESDSTLAEPGFGGSTFLVDADDDSVRATSGLFMSDGSDFARGSFTIDSGAELNCGTQTTLTISTTGDFTDNGSTWKCVAAVTNLDLAVTGTLTTNDIIWSHKAVDDFDLSAATWNAGGTTNVWNFIKTGALMDWNISTAVALNNLTYTGPSSAGTTSGLGGVITFDNTAATVDLNNTDIVSSANWDIASLDLDINSSINADEKGCLAGTTYNVHGQGPSTITNVCAASTSGYGKSGDGAAGAAHGGVGGRGGSVNYTAAAYDTDDANPILFGSGGGGAFGGASNGGNGGGLIILSVAGLLNNGGGISANGGSATHSSGSRGSGGSGGAVNITSGTFDGDGSIQALGGNGGNSSNTGYGAGGGGGGGKIHIGYASDLSSIITALDNTVHTAGGIAGTETDATLAVAGGSGTLDLTALTVPTTPAVTSPANTAIGVSRSAPTITGDSYASNGAAHSASVWTIYEDNAGSPGSAVWSETADIDGTKESSSLTDGTFTGALSGLSLLAPDTKYHIAVGYTNGAGTSTSSSNLFKTAVNTIPTTPSNSAPADAATSQSLNPTLTTSTYSDSDGDPHTASTWRVYESLDCTGTAVWADASDSTNKTSVAVTAAKGTFAGTHAGQTTLKAHTNFSFLAVYNDGYDNSSASTCTKFKTTNVSPVLGSNIANQSLTEDTDFTGAFDLDTYITDADWNDSSLTCTASDDLVSSLGSMTVNANNTVDFTLADDASGTDTIQFSCQDSATAAVSTNSITVNVTAVNDAPTLSANVPNQTVDEDTETAITLTLGDYFTDVDAGDTCTYSVVDDWDYGTIDITAGVATLSPDENVNGSDTVAFRCTDSGSATVDTNSFTISLTSINDAPSITGVVDVTIEEGTKLVIIAQGVDIDSSSLAFTASDVDGDFGARDYSIADLFVDGGNNSGTFTWTPGYQDAGDYGLGFSVSDGLRASSTNITVTVNPANDGPTFEGELPNVAIIGGQETVVVFDLDDYFADADGEELTYTAVGNSQVAVTIENGEVSLLSPNSFSGSESIIFRGIDAVDESAISNTVTVTSAAGVTLKNVSHITGKSKGKGIVKVYDKDNDKLVQFRTFGKGGAVPSIAEINNKGYIFAVKYRHGTTIHVHRLAGGKAIKKKKLAPNLHPRKVASGKLDDDKTDEEIVVVTKRGDTLYFRIFSYKPKKNIFGMCKRAVYKGVKGNKYRVAVEDKQVNLYSKKGKLKFSWDPFGQ